MGRYIDARKLPAHGLTAPRPPAFSEVEQGYQDSPAIATRPPPAATRRSTPPALVSVTLTAWHGRAA